MEESEGTFCNSTIVCTDNTECVNGECKCEFPYIPYVDVNPRGFSCKLEDTHFTYLKVSSSDNSSTDLEEFLRMEGLQCGNEGGQFYRNGRFDGIREGCFKNIFILITDEFHIMMGNGPKFDTLDIEVICNTTLMTYLSKFLKDDVNCSQKYVYYKVISIINYDYCRFLSAQIIIDI
ncbi:ITGB5 [Mytilus edulis]|uniref:ITGB5 n=1 Tax=Mytilus edulis TaxID=6550 RepID=A0A8S3VGC0_MYTED|nr:ITGB5 [Mytilus edulis]